MLQLAVLCCHAFIQRTWWQSAGQSRFKFLKARFLELPANFSLEDGISRESSPISQFLRLAKLEVEVCLVMIYPLTARQASSCVFVQYVRVCCVSRLQQTKSLLIPNQFKSIVMFHKLS